MGRKRGGGGLVLFSFVVCEGGEAEYFASDQVIGGGDLPDIVPPYPEGVGGPEGLSEALQVFEPGEGDGALEHDEGEECENSINVELVHAPEEDAENLEEKERGDELLRQEAAEFGDGDVEGVVGVDFAGAAERRRSAVALPLARVEGECDGTRPPAAMREQQLLLRWADT